MCRGLLSPAITMKAMTPTTVLTFFCHAVPVAALVVLSPNGRVCFLPPGCVVYQYDLGPYMMQNDLLAVPSAPGKALVFTLGTSNTPTVTNADLMKTLLSNPKMLPTMLMRCGAPGFTEDVARLCSTFVCVRVVTAQVSTSTQQAKLIRSELRCITGCSRYICFGAWPVHARATGGPAVWGMSKGCTCLGHVFL